MVPFEFHSPPSIPLILCYVFFSILTFQMYRSNQMRMHSMNPNRDEDTSGYLSDASNFVYSDVGLSNGLNGMRIGDNKPQMRQNRAMVVNDEVEYNEAEPVFSMSK